MTRVMVRVLCCLCGLILQAAAPLFAQRTTMPVSVAELQSRVRKDSNDAASHYNLALGLWSERRFDDAERELRLATSIEPDFAAAYLALAVLPYARRPSLWEEEAGHKLTDTTRTIIEEGDRMFRHAFLVDPLVDVRIVGAVTPDKSVFVGLIDANRDFSEYYYQAFDDLAHGDYEVARHRFQRLINDVHGETRPDRIPTAVLYWHGLCAAHVQRYGDAVNDFTVLVQRAQHAEQRDPVLHIPLGTNEYRYILADMSRRAGKLERAVSLYREVLENDPGLYQALVRLAEIAEQNNAVGAALGERRAAVNANPDDSGLLFNLGVTLRKAGQFAEAEQVLKQAIAANPRDTRSYYYLGVTQQTLGKTAEARAALTQFIALAPSRYMQQIQSAKQFLARP